MSKRPVDLVAKLGKQRGIASIIVVFIITILISLVSLGFARLMDRALRDVSNNQLGAAADYAAQSGLNDAISFVRSQKTIAPVKNCTDISNADTAIGGALSGKTILNNNNTTSDTSDDTKYTCVLIDPVPGDLAFQNITQYKSQVVKLQSSTGSMSEVTFGWEATDVGSRSSSGLTSGDFLNEKDWGSRRQSS